MAQPAPARQTRAEKKAETRERLLAAGERLAREEGFANITLEAVAEAAGLTKGAIYSNFESKEALVLEVAQRLTVGLDLTQRLEGAPDIDTLLARIAEAVAALARTRPKQLALAVEFEALLMRDPKLKRAIRRDVPPAAEHDDWFTAQGLTPPIPGNQFTEVIDALGMGLLMRRLVYGAKAVPNELIAWAFARLGQPG